MTWAIGANTISASRLYQAPAPRAAAAGESGAGETEKPQSKPLAPPVRSTPPAGPLSGPALLTAQQTAQAQDNGADPDALTPEEEEVIEALKARDAEVRRHEEAHARVGGQYAGAPSYEYQTGPDDNRYAVAGEVPIDIAPVAGDPEATIDKMEIVKRAALAPAEPSAQDRSVAAQADRIILEAQAELQAQRAEAAIQGQGQDDGASAFIQNYGAPVPAAPRAVSPGIIA